MHLAKLQTVTLFRLIVPTVVRHSAPATTATHSRVIRLCRVLTDHPPSGSSIDPPSGSIIDRVDLL